MPEIRFDSTTQSVLSLLAAGLTDEAVARQLHLGVRTVQRRISAYSEELGATSRFQLGCLSVSAGLVSVHHQIVADGHPQTVRLP
ncbi:LuxR C-terminal-related transcriptional regulator [Dactylosporangium siamense]|uniref:HTH luxR-type domain-containing protein n=2 Tax=Dactylosporangium siamense TaxID=685454 RepID=A0A919UE73_9ACTN|nr:hypothetical protein Dsi01nite_054090 [Dactylosporangium siamense]